MRSIVAVRFCCATLIALGLSSGCGRIRFQTTHSRTDVDASQRDGEIARDARAGFDAASLPGCPLLSGPWSLEDPENVETVNTESYEDEPSLAANGLTLYFGGEGPDSRDGFTATRSSLDSPFTNVQRVPYSTDGNYESGFMLTADATALYFERAAGDGQTDIWVVFPMREPAEAPGPIAELITSESQFDPWTLDGLSLYFATQDDDPRFSRMLVSSRDNTDEPFGAPREIPGIDAEVWNDNPTLTPDGLLIMFASNRPDGVGNYDLWYATRPDRSSPFGEAFLVPSVNTTSSESEVYISPYSCELYFSSTRPGGMGGQDIYRARFIPVE